MVDFPPRPGRRLPWLCLACLAGSALAQSAREHWAFRPLAGAGGTLDGWVARGLAAAGIEGSPEADRRTLLRRLSLDLLGLPPSPDAVAAFVADSRPDAWERQVSRLLASPHFGERWGRHWLDLARYADSDGYEKDNVRPHAWRWRDWVVDAVNRDLSFDRFTIEQLAGDLLPDATYEQRLATGFHRNTLTNREGGVDPEEFRVKAVVDRVNTTCSVWLGLTMSCAECHDHKYDPITQEEYYRLFAFFNDADERDIPAPVGVRERQVFDARRRRSAHALRGLRERVRQRKRELASGLAAWERRQRVPGAWHVLSPASAASRNGAVLRVLEDRSVLATGHAPASDEYTVIANTSLGEITAVRLEVLLDPSLPKRGPGRASHGNFVLNELTLEAAPLGALAGRPVRLTPAAASHSQPGWHDRGAVDGNDKTGWAIAPRYGEPHVAVFRTGAFPDEKARGTTLKFGLRQLHGGQHTIGRFRLAVRTGRVPPSALPADVRRILLVAPGQRPVSARQRLLEFYTSTHPTGRKLWDEWCAALDRPPRAPRAVAMVMARRAEPRATRLHERGDFLRPGAPVSPGTPSVLPRMTTRGERPDRLDLARWIVGPARRLSARVAANHVWRHLLGRGLVRTPEDFGTRGEPPTHPQLLDWLARTFVDLGWSRKALIRTIVCSETYRRSSRAAAARRDPANRLLARQGRFRVEAETIRDLALAVGGLLSREIGGPSVRPPLPPGVADLGYARSVRWVESKGADRYRRGLYIHFQRTVPYPMLMAFDCPESTVTCTRRSVSNSPLAALTTLNDPVFVECAQALARRVLGQAGPGDAARLDWLFQQCLARPPTGPESMRIRALLEQQLARFVVDPAAARRLVGSHRAERSNLPRNAAWVAVCRVVLNLDEFLSRS